MKNLSLPVYLFFVSSLSASAQIVAWQMSGTISSVSNVASTFTAGQTWTASFNVNYGASVGDSGANYAGYTNAVTNFVFQSGSYTTTAQVSPAYFYVYNNSVFGTPMDLLEIAFHSVTAPTVNGKSWNVADLQIRDSDFNAINSTALPGSVYLSAWTNESGGYIQWGTGPNPAQIQLALNSVTPSTIPEPATYAAITGLSVLGLTVTRRSRRFVRPLRVA